MPVLTMMSSERPEVEINLPAAEYIRRGQFKEYYCTFDIYPGKHHTLRPLYVIPRANANQLYTMRLKWENTSLPQPSPGMNTMVTILCDTTEKAPMTIPANAILHENGKTSVFLYETAQKKVRKCNIILIGLHTDGKATVTSAQIKPGDLIVSSGIHHIQDGETVTPLSATSKTNIGGLL